MADYAKKTNADLASLCKERGLAHSGKKAELVKRLEESDASDANGVAKPAAAAEDEIDWDEEPATEIAKAATTEASANAIAAGGVGEVKNPIAGPHQEAAIDAAKKDDLTVDSAPANTSEEKKEEVNFSTGLATRTLDEEIQKRKARARKFGMPEDSDEIKALERARKFGSTDLPGFLNKALPVKQDRKRGSDAPENDGGIRKKGRDRGLVGKRQGGGRGGSDKPRAAAKESGYPTWMTERDREAADKRKAKFSNAT